jgi:hypothetical protein
LRSQHGRLSARWIEVRADGTPAETLGLAAAALGVERLVTQDEAS